MKTQGFPIEQTQEYFCAACNEYFFAAEGLAPTCPKCGIQDSEWLQEVHAENDEDDYPAMGGG